MPIKWSAEKNETSLIGFQLLLKILETSEVTPNFKAISESWSATEEGEAPTPRAVQEQLKKIRAMNKGNGSMKITGGRGSAKSSPAKSSTPKNSKAKTVNGGKRKNASQNDDESDESAGVSESPSPTKKAKSEKKVDDNGNGIKPEPIDQMDGAVDVGFYMAAEI
ncbi:MAG: hypothetical protein Q9169_008442 [Polycauliona sp. 2 TL-2023]